MFINILAIVAAIDWICWGQRSILGVRHWPKWASIGQKRMCLQMLGQQKADLEIPFGGSSYFYAKIGIKKHPKKVNPESKSAMFKTHLICIARWFLHLHLRHSWPCPWSECSECSECPTLEPWHLLCHLGIGNRVPCGVDRDSQGKCNLGVSLCGCEVCAYTCVYIYIHTFIDLFIYLFIYTHIVHVYDLCMYISASVELICSCTDSRENSPSANQSPVTKWSQKQRHCQDWYMSTMKACSCCGDGITFKLKHSKIDSMAITCKLTWRSSFPSSPLWADQLGIGSTSSRILRVRTYWRPRPWGKFRQNSRWSSWWKSRIDSQLTTGWWLYTHPSEKYEFVIWDD